MTTGRDPCLEAIFHPDTIAQCEDKATQHAVIKCALAVVSKEAKKVREEAG